MLVAEHQTAGRGRLDRTWETPARSALTVSVLLVPRVAAADWPWLPLLTGYAAARALRQLGAGVTLKWPNDVLLGDRKLAGILTERVDTPTGPAVVAGRRHQRRPDARGAAARRRHVARPRGRRDRPHRPAVGPAAQPARRVRRVPARTARRAPLGVRRVVRHPRPRGQRRSAQRRDARSARRPGSTRAAACWSPDRTAWCRSRPVTSCTPRSAPLVEEGALAPVTKPGERSAEQYRGFVTGLTALLNQRLVPPCPAWPSRRTCSTRARRSSSTSAPTRRR